MKSESNQQNYWMIQYQRLLDAKPLSLRMQVQCIAEQQEHTDILHVKTDCGVMNQTSYRRKQASRRN